MRTEPHPAEAAQQYFHTYRVSKGSEEIVLREYDLSVQSLSGGQRGIALATGLTVVAIGFLGTVLSSDRGIQAIHEFIANADWYAEAGIYAGVFSVALIAVRYFAELQRGATQAARKIVVLRRLLGIDYGNIERVMPTGTLEGANEPYALPLFPGWGSISSLSALLVAPFVGVLVTTIFGAFSARPATLSSRLLSDFPNADVAGLAVWLASTACLLSAFRLWLLERWESRRFLVGKAIGAALNCPLKDRMGHVLYRMELSAFEARRVGIDLPKFYPFLIAIEDKRFKKHSGNDWIAVLRALWQRMRFGFVSGGSTIHQQLFRSTCIRRIERRWTRKAVEWTMAPWLAARYDKNSVLDMYLSSVRFDRGIIGLPAALEHFFGLRFSSSTRWSPSPAQIVFLVERLSNVSRSLPINRVRSIVGILMREGLLQDADVRDLEFIYSTMITDGFVTGDAQNIDLKPLAAGKPVNTTRP